MTALPAYFADNIQYGNFRRRALPGAVRDRFDSGFVGMRRKHLRQVYTDSVTALLTNAQRLQFLRWLDQEAKLVGFFDYLPPGNKLFKVRARIDRGRIRQMRAINAAQTYWQVGVDILWRDGWPAVRPLANPYTNNAPNMRLIGLFGSPYGYEAANPPVGANVLQGDDVMRNAINNTGATLFRKSDASGEFGVLQTSSTNCDIGIPPGLNSRNLIGDGLRVGDGFALVCKFENRQNLAEQDFIIAQSHARQLTIEFDISGGTAIANRIIVRKDHSMIGTFSSAAANAGLIPDNPVNTLVFSVRRTADTWDYCGLLYRDKGGPPLCTVVFSDDSQSLFTLWRSQLRLCAPNPTIAGDGITFRKVAFFAHPADTFVIWRQLQGAEGDNNIYGLAEVLD